MFKILLTGATGIVGSNILKELSQNNQIFILIRKKPTQKKFFHKNIIFVKFIDYEELNKKLKKLKVDIVIHCATHYIKNHNYKDIKKLINANILLGNIILENLLDMKVKKFINFSTVWQDPHPKKNDFQNLYAAYKSSFNKIVNFYRKILTNVEFFEIVLSDTFGFGDKRNKLINTLKNNFLTNRTTKIVSTELNIDETIIKDCIEGKLNESDSKDLIFKFYKKYPISLKEIYIENDNTNNKKDKLLPELTVGELVPLEKIHQL